MKILDRKSFLHKYIFKGTKITKQLFVGLLNLRCKSCIIFINSIKITFPISSGHHIQYYFIKYAIMMTQHCSKIHISNIYIINDELYEDKRLFSNVMSTN